MTHKLEINDKVKITTQDGEVHSAIVLDIGSNDIFLKLAGFGKLSIKWEDIWLIKKVIEPISRGLSYSATYEVKVFDNNDSQLAVS